MTLTKSWLQKQITDLEATRDEIPFGLDEDGNNMLAAFKTALAGMEAVPVIWQANRGGEWFTIGEYSVDYYRNDNARVRQLYAAPQPATVVPDEMTPKQASREYCGEVRGYRDGFNACRASMLQGAAGNSPVIPDGWVACSERLPDETNDPDGGATCYLVLYAEGRQPNGGSNVQVSNVTYLRRWHDGMITHWMPLPAAPQQEAVSSALEHGMARYYGAMQKLADGGD